MGKESIYQIHIVSLDEKTDDKCEDQQRCYPSTSLPMIGNSDATNRSIDDHQETTRKKIDDDIVLLIESILTYFVNSTNAD